MGEVNIHASCVAIGGHGVLFLGKSGAGKSDLALRLIDRGAVLVADDRTLLWVENGTLQARAPETIRGLLEIRGLGIVQYRFRAKIRIALVVRVGAESARLPAPCFYRPPVPLKLQVPVPEIRLDSRSASAPAKVHAALKAFSKGLFRDTFISK